MNNFYSFVGDALLGDLEDSNGTPYYRILPQAGKIISDFEQTDAKEFQYIIKEWYNLLGALLQNAEHKSILEFTFPEKFTNWLLASNNGYISNIGDKLLNQNNTIKFTEEDIWEEIVIRGIFKTISEEIVKSHFDFIAYSNPDITHASLTQINLPIESERIHFITYLQIESWGKLIEERRKKLNTNLTYDKFLLQNETFINLQIESSFEKIMKSLEFIQGFAFFANFSLWKREKIRSLFEDKDFLHTFYECEKRLSDNISSKVQNFREQNEYNIFNDYEEKIDNLLGIDFIPVPQSVFKDYYYPMEYSTAIRNFVEIIVSFNEDNANEDLGMGFLISSVDSLVNNKSNHYIEILKCRLQDYYKYYCLGNLKDSLQRIWYVYEYKVENKKDYNNSSGCYITTAMCSYLGKQDDCYELTILRGFRDNWLRHQTNGENLIQEYYNYAPTIVDKLNNNPDRDSIYNHIYKCVYKCLAYIREQKFERAKNEYIHMVRVLSHKFLQTEYEENFIYSNR